MARVFIPVPLRELTAGQTEVEVQVEPEGTTVRAVVDALEERYPGIKARLCSGDASHRPSGRGR